MNDLSLKDQLMSLRGKKFTNPTLLFNYLPKIKSKVLYHNLNTESRNDDLISERAAESRDRTKRA